MYLKSSFAIPAAILLTLNLVGGHLPGQDLERLEEAAVEAAIARVDVSVLQIETIGGLDRVGGSAANVGPTTATVIDEDGFLISSAFNFIHKPASIFVKLPGGERAACQIVARDRSRNLILLKVDTDKKLSVPKWVRRDQLRVGGWAIAVGRVFDSESTNISVGIISATNRIWGKAIQADAKISPNNFGGPLVDIDGNVIGILTPLSTRGESETAGVDWYDSGIGFAVPLAEIMPRLDRLKKGEDLFPGRIGVSFKGKNIYADSATVAALVGTSPAAKAGIRSGDVIVEFAGKPIRRQSELRHAIGPFYADDTVKVVVERADKRMEFSVVLAKKIDPYIEPYLGLLLATKSDQDSAEVRFVFKNSPAAKAGIQVGDILEAIDGVKIDGADSIRQQLFVSKIDQKVAIQVSRKGTPVDTELIISAAETTIPESLEPPATVEVASPYPTGVVELKVPEEPNLCHAFVPEKQFAAPPGVMVWIPKPGEIDFEKMVKPWQSFCNQRNFILLGPQSADKSKWVPDDAEFIQKAIDQLKLTYPIDEERVAIGGESSGAAMAALTAFGHRNQFRGLVLANAAIPRRAGRISTDPVNRMHVMVVSSAAVENDKTGTATMKQLKTAKIAAVHRQLNGAERIKSISIWLDALGRF